MQFMTFGTFHQNTCCKTLATSMFEAYTIGQGWATQNY